MKRFVIGIFAFVLISNVSFAQLTNYINPSGIYKLDSKVTKKNGETYGYFGDIKVLSTDKSRILISFFVCKGAPSYNSGSFVDTLDYINNIAIYKGDPETDSTCNITMSFLEKGIDVDLKSENLNFACGFGHAVDPHGFYYKLKGKIPKKEEILKEGN